MPERESLLRECCESVCAQVHTDYVHLVGTDHDGEGPAAVRNRLARDASEASFLVPLDDDDLVDPNFLSTLASHLEGADVIYSWCRVEDFVPGLPAWTPNRLFRAEALLRFNFIPVTACISRDLWDAVGGMDEGVQVEDWLFWKKCLAEGARFRLVPEVLWTYRRGVSSESRNEWASLVAK